MPEENIIKIIVILLIGIALLYWLNKKYSRSWKKPIKPFPKEWRTILKKEISFYRHLNHDERELFEYKLKEFIINVKITGIETIATTTDKVMVASSAVIPIFAFPEWKYKNLKEVLLYPANFNLDFETKGNNNNRRILGMVGTGYMNDKMILSKTALHRGFQNETDKKNTAIHEFVHLIDKMDGDVDGIPRVLLEKQYVIPWIDMIERKLEEIVKNKSDINPYATTGREEFFAVLSEYFFERPRLLKKKHPELYDMLEEIFDQDLLDHES